MLTQLPDVVIDLILQRYLTPDDLRAAHQVSTGWRSLITSRTLVNERRLARVEAIRNDKENVISRQTRSRGGSRSSTDSLPFVRRYRLKKCKPFRELNDNTTSDDNNNNSSSNSNSSPMLIRNNSNNNKSKPNSQLSITTSDSDSASTTIKTKSRVVSVLGNVKRKSKASLRRIANL